MGNKINEYAVAIGINKDGKLELVEKFKGALEAEYKHNSGSIYEFPGDDFERRTAWSGEVVCPH
jgi:hypothetical protein